MPFTIREPENLYSMDEIADLLAKAEGMGFSLGKGSELDNYTIRELDILVNRKM